MDAERIGVRCPAAVWRPLTLTKGISPALASIPVTFAGRPFQRVEKTVPRFAEQHSGMRESRKDHETLPNGVLVGYRDLLFAEPHFPAHCASSQ
jgi:hypothetical protein